ncbi:MAG: LamG-like jellyroll fold domain-containing protein [Eubacteriales bacterium]
MKKILCLVIIAVLYAVMIIPVSAAVPNAWFELGYKDGAPYDIQGNLVVEIQFGEIVETTVTHDNKAYPVTAFVGDSDQEGMLVNLPFEDDAAYGEWLLSGCTFELFIELESLAENGTCGFFTCVNGGGSSLYYRNGGEGLKQFQFQIGTTDAESADNNWGGNYAGAAASEAKDGPGYFEAGKILHCVGTYDKVTNMLNIYYNGELVSSGSYGNGTFKIGSAFYNVLGIGINPAYPSESLGAGCEFRVVGAKLYKAALTEGEVAEVYKNSIAALTGEKVTAEEPVLTDTETLNAETVAADTSADDLTAKQTSAQTFDVSVILSITLTLAIAGYIASRKHF